MDDTERARGARLLAAMTPGPWVSGGARDSHFIRRPDPDGKAVVMVTAREPGDTGPAVAFTPDWTFGNSEDDAEGICWLVNHAGELLAESAEVARYLEALQWYAAAEAWELDADGGVKAWALLERTGKLPPSLADADREAYAALREWPPPGAAPDEVE